MKYIFHFYNVSKIILYYSNGSVEVKMNVVQIISNVIKAYLVGIWNPMLVHIYMYVVLCQ